MGLVFDGPDLTEVRWNSLWAPLSRPIPPQSIEHRRTKLVKNTTRSNQATWGGTLPRRRGEGFVGFATDFDGPLNSVANLSLTTGPVRSSGGLGETHQL